MHRLNWITGRGTCGVFQHCGASILLSAFIGVPSFTLPTVAVVMTVWIPLIVGGTYLELQLVSLRALVASRASAGLFDGDLHLWLKVDDDLRLREEKTP